EQAELSPAGQPQLDVGDVKTNEPLEFVASFEVYPDIALQGLDDISVEKPQVEVTEADIDATVERIREQHKTFETVERESRDGDQVVVDYVGRIRSEEHTSELQSRFDL